MESADVVNPKAGSEAEEIWEAFRLGSELEERERRADAKLLAAFGRGIVLEEMFALGDMWATSSHDWRYRSLMGACDSVTTAHCAALAKCSLNFLINVLPVDAGHKLVVALRTHD